MKEGSEPLHFVRSAPAATSRRFASTSTATRARDVRDEIIVRPVRETAT
jgi:hypothetical protein